MRHVALLALSLAAAGTFAAFDGGTSATAGGSGRPKGSQILSADLRLRAGHAKTILSVPRVGRWTATCSANAEVGVTFTAAQLLATSDLVVSRTAGAPLGRRIDPGAHVTPDPAGPVLSQRWQIAPFAAAQVHVVAATVVGRTAGAADCAASVVAVVGPDQGATRTG